MELAEVIANATMKAAAEVVNARHILNPDAERLVTCLRQAICEDFDGILAAMKDAQHMGNNMLRWVLATECAATATRAVDIYQQEALRAL